ncbi:MAG: hypothetical protein AAF170_15505 [Bacteroidota bacterium]
MTCVSLFRSALLAFCVLLTACGSDADAAQDATPDPGPESVTEDASSEVASSTDPMPAAAPALPGLAPGDVSPNDPIPARELRDAVMALIGQTVTVQGEAASAFSPRGPAIRMSANPGNVDAPFVECVFPSEAEGSLPSGEAIVRGTVGPPNLAGQQKLTMTDCVVVETASEAMSVSDLADRIAGWVGTEVAIVGTYNGATTSSLRDGDVVDLRVQDDGTEGVAEQVARCQMPAGSTAPEIADRQSVIFQGTIGGDSMFWGADKAVLLSECTPVNR